jgi:hypothetical protein
MIIPILEFSFFLFMAICFVIPLIRFVIFRIRENPVRNKDPRLVSSKCEIKKVIFVQKNSSEEGSQWIPNIEYSFEGDPHQRKFHIERYSGSGGFLGAYDTVFRFLPEGTPFEFKPEEIRTERSWPKDIWEAGKELGLYLKEKEIDFLSAVKWNGNPNPTITLMHPPGDFRSNEMNLRAYFNKDLITCAVFIVILAFMMIGYFKANYPVIPPGFAGFAVAEALVSICFAYLYSVRIPAPKMYENRKLNFLINREAIANIPKRGPVWDVQGLREAP